MRTKEEDSRSLPRLFISWCRRERYVTMQYSLDLLCHLQTHRHELTARKKRKKNRRIVIEGWEDNEKERLGREIHKYKRRVRIKGKDGVCGGRVALCI